MSHALGIIALVLIVGALFGSPPGRQICWGCVAVLLALAFVFLGGGHHHRDDC